MNIQPDVRLRRILTQNLYGVYYENILTLEALRLCIKSLCGSLFLKLWATLYEIQLGVIN